MTDRVKWGVNMAKPSTTIVGPKKRRGGVLTFFRESWRELERVRWPSRAEVTSYTVACLITCLALALLVWGFDVGVSKLMSLIGLV